MPQGIEGTSENILHSYSGRHRLNRLFMRALDTSFTWENKCLRTLLTPPVPVLSSRTA